MSGRPQLSHNLPLVITQLECECRLNVLIGLQVTAMAWTQKLKLLPDMVLSVAASTTGVFVFMLFVNDNICISVAKRRFMTSSLRRWPVISLCGSAK